MGISVSGNAEVNEHVDTSTRVEFKLDDPEQIPLDDVFDTRKFELQYTAAQNKERTLQQLEETPVAGITAQESGQIDSAIQAIEQSMLTGDRDAAVELALQLNGRTQEYRTALLDRLIERFDGNRVADLVAAAGGAPRNNYERRITSQQQQIIAQTIGEAYDAGVVGSDFVEQLLNGSEMVHNYNQFPITTNNGQVGTIIGLSSSAELKLDFANRAIARAGGDGVYDRLYLLDATKAVASSGNLLGQVLPQLSDSDLEFITQQNPRLTAQLLETSNFIQYRDGNGNPAVSPDALRLFYTAAGMNTRSSELQLAAVEFFARNGVDIAIAVHTNRALKDKVEDFFLNYVYTVSPTDHDNPINQLIYGKYDGERDGLPVFKGGAIQNILAGLTERAANSTNARDREAAGYAFGSIIGVMLDAADEVRDSKALTADRISATVSSLSNFVSYRGTSVGNIGDLLGQAAKEAYLNWSKADADQQTIDNLKEDFLDALQARIEELTRTNQITQANALDNFRDGIESGLIARR